jgi:hypothetical protein
MLSELSDFILQSGRRNRAILQSTRISQTLTVEQQETTLSASLKPSVQINLHSNRPS